jgi:hypothetical protein
VTLTETRPHPLRSGSLLPAALESARGAVPVTDPLTVKGCPGYAPTAQPGRLAEVVQIWRRSGVLAHVGVGPEESYMLIDKRHPHAEREVMMMSSGARVLAGLHEHSAAFGMALGAVAACFAEHCRTAGLYPVLSWSYDPATVDRESIQGEKRFHAHLVGRTAAELKRVDGLAVPARACPPLRRRRIVDEASVLGAALAADCLADTRLRAMEMVEPLSTPQATAALQLRVPGGWGAFTDPGLLADLAAVHGTLRRIYNAVAAACLTGPSGTWRRPALDPAQADNVQLPLTATARSALGHYLTALRPELLTDITTYTDPGNRAWTTHVYPLADLAYSVCFSEHHGVLFGHVRINVFSDLGGAGVSVINGTVVKIRKGVGVYDEPELAARAAFQRDFATALRRHPEHGSAALYPQLASH